MKIKTLLLMAITAITATACSSKSTSQTQAVENTPKAVVCFYSASGVTKTQAQRLADILGADIHEIVPETIYTEADLDWRNPESRSSVEMKDPASRPAIANNIDLSQYDVVFIGYPNWWNTAPRIINTFIEANDLTGKTIVPFMTSGGSDIANSEKDLTETYPTLHFSPGLLMNDVTDEAITAWLAPLNL